MTPGELREAEKLVDDLRPRLEMRRSRRYVLHHHGRHPIATDAARNLQSGGEMEVGGVGRACAPGPSTVICDVSGSMERHSRLLIRFTLALRRVSGVRTEAFVFGTHLTRVTRELAGATRMPP